jgi:transcriptional regulator with XRE-family HTH domain
MGRDGRGNRPAERMDELDKRAMGRRIRQIRAAAGLKQWELAARLGTTQSAVHKYERGVVPEPRRLIEIARIGNTTIEWILTGQHWESGSSERERLPGPVLDLAQRLSQLGLGERAAVEEALRLMRDALDTLEAPASPPPSAEAASHALRVHGASTLRLLEAAWRIQRAVLARMVEGAAERLESSEKPSED